MTAALDTPTLAACEAVIERGLATFVEVGQALLRIRDERLYRESHKTFETYCRERWSMSKTHANRKIDAAAVAGTLTPIGVTPNLEVARELAPLKSDPDAVRAAMAEAVEQHGERPTARQVREVVAEVVPRPGAQETKKLNAVDRTIGHLCGFAAGLPDDDDLGRTIAAAPPEKAKEWATDLACAIKAIRKYQRRFP